MPVKTDIEAEIRRIGRLLTIPCEFTHFGGCSMALQDIKDSTIDVDVVLQPASAFSQLLADLHADYTWVNENEQKEQHQPEHLRGHLNDWAVVHGPLQFDFFPPGRIFNALEYSDAMLARRRPHITSGNLQTYVSDPTVTFLLKAITGRWANQAGRDLEDLQSILDRRRIDWTFISDEWRRQLPACPNGPLAQERAREAVAHLRARGYTITWDP